MTLSTKSDLLSSGSLLFIVNRDTEISQRRQLFNSGLRLSARYGYQPDGQFPTERKKTHRTRLSEDTADRRCQVCQHLCYLSMVSLHFMYRRSRISFGKKKVMASSITSPLSVPVTCKGWIKLPIEQTDCNTDTSATLPTLLFKLFKETGANLQSCMSDQMFVMVAKRYVHTHVYTRHKTNGNTWFKEEHVDELEFCIKRLLMINELTGTVMLY